MIQEMGKKKEKDLGMGKSSRIWGWGRVLGFGDGEEL
jgi:hypothetical protein